MARYVVVEFAHNADAEAFVGDMNKSTQEGQLWRIAGIFVKPVRYCACPDWPRLNAGDKNIQYGVQRGEKFGWWVCDYCKKPRRGGHQLVNQVLASELYPELLRAKDDDYEFVVSGLQIGGIHTKNIDRPKKLKKVRKLWRRGS